MQEFWSRTRAEHRNAAEPQVGFDNLTYGGEVGGSISSACHTTLLSHA